MAAKLWQQSGRAGWGAVSQGVYRPGWVSSSDSATQDDLLPGLDTHQGSATTQTGQKHRCDKHASLGMDH